MRTLLTADARRVFVDSAAFLARVDRRDTNYEIAQAVVKRLAAERWRTFTTNFVVAETHALILSRRGYAMATMVLRQFDAPTATTIIRVTEDDELRARQIIYQYRDKDFSLTDALSFAVMDRQRIGHAFTFDRHFAQYGFPVFRDS